MRFKYFLYLLFLVLCSPTVVAQLCTGSLGDPVVKLDFGTGTNSHGAALGTGITSYTYSSADFPSDGSYTIEKATNTSGTWWTTTDHTGGGYMMVVNASFSVTDYFYQNTVSGLCPGTTYEFAAWVMNLLRSQDNSPPDITFTIERTDGSNLGTYSTGSIPLASSAVWKQYGYFFTTPADVSTVVIRMRNNKAGAAPGNDIALDDITFRACGPTVTSVITNQSSTSLDICENAPRQITLNGSVSSSNYTTIGYQWQTSTDGGSSWTDIAGANSDTYTFTTTTSGVFKYRLATAEGANIGSSGCRVVSNEIDINVKITPLPSGATSQSFCTTQNPTLATIEVTGTNILWYNLATGGVVLSNDTPLVSGNTYYASQTISGCESDIRLPVTVTVNAPSLNGKDVSDILCDELNDGTELVNLTNYNSNFSSDPSAKITFFSSFAGAENNDQSLLISNASDYSIETGENIIYARIVTSDKCSQAVTLTLTLFEMPVLTVTDSVFLCENATVTVDAGDGFDSYLWSTSETTKSIVISSEGNYSVTVSKNNGKEICSFTKNFKVVLSNVAVISNVTIEEWTDEKNSITALISKASKGDYEYSLDGITYQDSNYFSDLSSGNYTLYVRDKNGCGIATDSFYILNFPRYFTPNGDGYNDTWKIKLSENEQDLKTRIFDRYGKLIIQIDNISAWDGTYNGHVLPATDYWFEVFRVNKKIFRGHFALKR